MDESGCKKCDPDRDMDGMPECQQFARSRQRGSLSLRIGHFDLSPIDSARDEGVDIASNKATDNDDDRQQGGDASEAVELPRCV